MQSRRRIRVKNRKFAAEKSLATWIQGQDTQIEAPDHYLGVNECRTLAASGKGRFFNRGTGFLRFDTCIPKDKHGYHPSAKTKGLSQKIDDAVMDRFVIAQADRNDDPHVIAAVESWA